MMKKHYVAGGEVGVFSPGNGGGLPPELLELLELLPVPEHREASLASVPSGHFTRLGDCCAHPARKTMLIAINETNILAFISIFFFTLAVYKFCHGWVVFSLQNRFPNKLPATYMNTV